MRSMSIILVATLMVFGPIAASAQAQVSLPEDAIVVVHQWLDAFNAGKRKLFVSACADQVSIIDEFPPYAWQGTGACRRYWSDFAEHSRAVGLTEAVVKFDRPSHVEAAGDDLYLTGPARLTFKIKGKSLEETGSYLTVTLHEGKGNWKITGWAWSNPE